MNEHNKPEESPEPPPPKADPPPNSMIKKDAAFSNADIERDIEDIVLQAEKRGELVKRLKLQALKSTTNSDWINQDGKPFLKITGAEKIAPLFNVRISDSRRERNPETGYNTDTIGKNYRWWYFGTAQILSVEGNVLYEIPEVVGSCSSRDEFFGKKGGVFRTVEEIDEADICKKAYSDMVRNGVSRILGLRSCSWEELKTVNIEEAKVESIKRGKEASPELKKKQEELRTIIKSYIGNDADKCRAELKKIAEFGDKKITCPEDITTDKWMGNVLKKAKEAKAKFDKTADTETKTEEKKDE